MKKDIKFLIARNRMLYGRKEADWDTDDYAKFVNEYLQQQGYNKVDVEYVDDYPQGNADEQAPCAMRSSRPIVRGSQATRPTSTPAKNA
jgi:hypothetical protein